ncbi:MAG: hypothetical protein KJP09_07895 [Bacteroidia bacterium]|nr:hypothetical protein [Bacteroidia bacterium]NND10636.1 hypothetical protein [Flavobacteriaceae bacterium]MBT8309839.1 hypothetical protein [Bacteroidia bacterium]NNK26649.1 hypothetical protein [Flavobacteriaceae bacterium]NNL61815.1 hypothetical protein [Flavobacteriaceae bacterium]
MTIELITFIGAILFGILLYWRESNGNGLYRFINKLAYSKELQMKAEDKKGFIYQQSLLLRIVYITAFFLIGIVITRFLIPIDLATISLFASMIVGTLAGTYIAAFVFKSGEVIDEKSDSFEDVLQDTIDKGKDFIEDLKSKETDVTQESQEITEEVQEEVKPEEKSARERLKDKGLL